MSPGKMSRLEQRTINLYKYGITRGYCKARHDPLSDPHMGESYSKSHQKM